MDRKVLEVSSLSLSFSDYLPTYLSIFYLSIYLSVYLSICLSVYLSICLSVYLSICLSVYLSICLSVDLSIYLSIHLSIYLSVCLSIYLSIFLSIYLSVYLSILLSISLSVYKPMYLSLKIFFKCPTPASIFGNATKPSRFAHFCQGAQSLAPATRSDIWTSKSAPNPSVVLHFWLGNMLRDTTACTFSTSERPKVVREWCVLYILTSKCASHHNGVHFFDISTSKSGPTLRCFVHFHFEMCFAPQRRAHLNFQKCSETQVFCTFSLGNVLRATTACNFWSLIWASWLRTRRFSEPTFRPSGAPNHSKNTVFCDFPTFPRICIFFLLTLSLLLFSLLVFLFALPLPYSAFHLSILSEVWLLNFLRLVTSTSSSTSTSTSSQAAPRPANY